MQLNFEVSLRKLLFRLEALGALQLNLSTLLLKSCLEISTDLLVFLGESTDTTQRNLALRTTALPHSTYIENHLGMDVYLYPESDVKTRRMSMSKHAVTLKGSLSSDEYKIALPYTFKSVTLDTNEFRSIRNLAIYTNRSVACYLHRSADSTDERSQQEVASFIWDSEFTEGRRRYVERSDITDIYLSIT